MTATSPDAESLREKIDALQKIADELDRVAERYVTDPIIQASLRVDARWLRRIAAQPASSAASQSPDLRAAVERLRIDSITDDAEFAAHDIAWNDALDAVLALLDTAQPDLRRTPEAEIDVETLGRLAWDVFRPGKIDARPNAATLRWYGERIKAALAATPAPAEEE